MAGQRRVLPHLTLHHHLQTVRPREQSERFERCPPPRSHIAISPASLIIAEDITYHHDEVVPVYSDEFATVLYGGRLAVMGDMDACHNSSWQGGAREEGTWM